LVDTLHYERFLKLSKKGGQLETHAPENLKPRPVKAKRMLSVNQAHITRSTGRGVGLWCKKSKDQIL